MQTRGRRDACSDVRAGGPGTRHLLTRGSVIRKRFENRPACGSSVVLRDLDPLPAATERAGAGGGSHALETARVQAVGPPRRVWRRAGKLAFDRGVPRWRTPHRHRVTAVRQCSSPVSGPGGVLPRTSTRHVACSKL